MTSAAEDLYSEIVRLEQQIRVYSKLKDISKFNKADFDFNKISDSIMNAIGLIGIRDSWIHEHPLASSKGTT